MAVEMIVCILFHIDPYLLCCLTLSNIERQTVQAAHCSAVRLDQSAAFNTVMVSPRGQAGLEPNILSSDSASKNCPRPRAFVLGMSSNFLFCPRENECNNGTGNHCEFAMIIYHSYT